MTQLCTLASGSSGNALLASHGDTHLLIDAGLSLRRLKAALSEFDLSPDRLSAVLITHEHSDHISGLSTLTNRLDLPVYASRGTSAYLLWKMPWLCDRLFPFEAGHSFSVGGVEVDTFSTPHDTPDSVGYTLRMGGVRASVATDLGYVPEHVLNKLLGSDYLLLESNHDVEMLRTGAYPAFLKRRILGKNGHLSNEDSARAAAACVRAGTRHITLGHLSRDNNSPETAFEAAVSFLRDEGLEAGRDVCLDVAPRCGRSLVFSA